jgi:hypothetical protein
MGNVSDSETILLLRNKREDARLSRDEEVQTEGFLRVTTAPNPRVFSYGPDAGQRGWRLHLVEGVPSDDFPDLPRRALCGTWARHGWGLDFFIDQECARCTKAFARLQDKRMEHAR